MWNVGCSQKWAGLAVESFSARVARMRAKGGVRTVAREMQHRRGANPRSSAHQNVGRAHAIVIPNSNRWIGHGGAVEAMISVSADWTEVVGRGFEWS